MSKTVPVSQPGIGDPFQHLASKIREMVITYLGSYENLDCLCLASPIIRKERQTSTLLLTSESLERKFGGSRNGAFVEAHMYLLLSKNGLSHKDFELWQRRKLPHPLFSTRSDMVFRMNALYHRLMDCFNFGPGLVPWFIQKLPSSVFACYAAQTFGNKGERFLASLNDATDVKKG
jgi:hypothetical protein